MKLRSWLFRVALIYCASLLLFSIFEWAELNRQAELPVLPSNHHAKQEILNATIPPAVSTAASRYIFGRTDNKWVRIAYTSFQVLVFSAYLDLRSSDSGMGKTPAVRLPIIMESKHKDEWLKESMFVCYFPQLNASVNAHLYEQCENHDQRYGSFIANCFVDISWTENLSSVQLRPSKSADRDGHHEIVISKSLVVKERPPFNTTVCVHSPIFGHAYSSEYIVRYVELTRLLGAEHFIFYIASGSARRFEDQRLLGVLRYYEASGLATIVDFGLPIDRPSDIWYHGQSSAVQDCIYRSVGSTNFLVLTDLDEFIVPLASVNWNTMFQQIWANRPNATGFHVQPLYFNYPQWKKRAEFAPFIHFETTESGSPFFRLLTKCVVKPERVFEMGIHHISKQFHNYFSNEQLDKSIARLHHYKSRQSMDSSDSLRVNTIMLRYKNDFGLRVHKVLYKYL
uniref:Glycosyltransferase family 92 protein n=1 Tax=Plectus sambesii TaxID=2011161 RepID=A0A914WRI8_9BILA